MISIEIDGHIYQVEPGDNILQACLSLGIDLPYFCWHPSLGSVGACRQCAVVQFNDRHDQEDADTHDEVGRVVMGCMTPVTEGMRIAVNNQTAMDFRSGVIEFLMTNHPHDCPVCEEGGECHLQDMTEMTGHTWREYEGLKRTHRNQNLGPFINHEMNRCIACYRCVRYYDDYAGGKDLQALGAHHHVYFGRHEDGTLESGFSGNLVEVCPTGVFTDKTFSAHYSRKWDLQTAPSICVHCSQGCNTSPGERYGRLRRISNRYNHEVNGYFLCDRGRFGYGFVNRDDRLEQPLALRSVDEGGEVLKQPLSRSATRDQLVNLIGPEQRLLGVGSPRASLETNHALRTLVGAANFYPGFSDQESQVLRAVLHTYAQSFVHVPSIPEVEACDAVLILGEDVLNTSPRLALALRQSVRNEALELADELRIPRWQDHAVREAAQQTQSPLYMMTPGKTGIDDIATASLRGNPQDIKAWGQGILNALEQGEGESEVGLIAQALLKAKRPLIVTGTGLLSFELIDTAAEIAEALSSQRENQPVDCYAVVPESNSLGLALLVGIDGLDNTLSDARERAHSHDVDTLVVAENDLYRRAPASQINGLLNAVPHTLIIEQQINESVLQADLALPAASFAESEGTLVSAESRAQRYLQVHPAQADRRPAWEWLVDLIALREQAEPRWQHLDEVTADCAAAVPSLSAIVDAAPDASFRRKGMKLPRQTHRASGRTAMNAHLGVSEPKQPQDEDSSLAFSMEGYPGEKPAALTAYYWSPGWNSNQSIGKFQQEMGGALKTGDPGVRLVDQPEFSQAFSQHESNSINEPIQSEQGSGWLVIPSYEMFGSEELSALAEPITERGPEAYAVLNPEDAASLNVNEADGIDMQIGPDTYQLEVLVDEVVQPGSVHVSAGFQITAGLDFSTRAELEKALDWQPRRPVLIATDQTASFQSASSETGLDEGAPQ